MSRCPVDFLGMKGLKGPAANRSRRNDAFESLEWTRIAPATVRAFLGQGVSPLIDPFLRAELPATAPLFILETAMEHTTDDQITRIEQVEEA